MSRLHAEVAYWLEHVGYWLRPYDALADRRRWFWQPAMRCGLPPPIAADVQRAVERMVAAQAAARCPVPPDGWWCSREPGHDGPCAARRRVRTDGAS